MKKLTSNLKRLVHWSLVKKDLWLLNLKLLTRLVISHLPFKFLIRTKALVPNLFTNWKLLVIAQKISIQSVNQMLKTQINYDLLKIPTIFRLRNNQMKEYINSLTEKAQAKQINNKAVPFKLKTQVFMDRSLVQISSSNLIFCGVRHCLCKTTKKLPKIIRLLTSRIL